MELLPSTPFVLTLPSNATVNSGGEVVADLTPEGLGVIQKTDVQLMGPVVVDLDSANGFLNPIIWRPGFAGTITRVTMTIIAGPITTGPGVATVAVAGVACTTSAPISAPAASAQGFTVDVAVTAGGAFTADQLISVTPSGTNAELAQGCVGLEYTRA